VTSKKEEQWQNCRLTTWAIGREDALAKLDPLTKKETEEVGESWRDESG
jgi:hypothetical protein